MKSSEELSPEQELGGLERQHEERLTRSLDHFGVASRPSVSLLSPQLSAAVAANFVVAAAAAAGHRHSFDG
ncbi:hypothetical protein VIGAN_01129100 [Vigna angularis var. angularis]|uniref:Uncharacterized protein n=1 Tax=Vigna angularis var. angularis TaxID=157739 RepID=A0A0S3QZL1_PHAAN|nr:hypothetical protein VIGAN_01129100 [Vigna angularis var. angularis]